MAKKAGSNALSYKVRIFNETGVVQRRAEVVSQDAKSTLIRYKKPRSSKYAYRPIPTDNIVAIETGSDKGTLISYKGRQQIAEYRGHVESDPKSGMLKIVCDDGRTVMAHHHLVEAEADDNSDAPAPAKKASGDKPAAKKKTKG